MSRRPPRLQLAARVDEQLRRVSSRTTKHIALRAGSHYGMVLGGGYPKSGTSWLCQLLSGYLDIPHPQNYSMPIAMRAVLHNHWMYDERFPLSAYVVRDGRDVLVSMYFYSMRSIALPRHPRQAARLRERFTRVLGSGYDPEDVSRNLPRFLEVEFTDPIAVRGVTWGRHVRSWCAEPHRNVVVTRYERLLADAGNELARVVEAVTGAPADLERVARTVTAHDFSGSGRDAGHEDRTSFMRRGVQGDWRDKFSRDAAEVFEHYAGDDLRLLGYEQDAHWVDEL